MTAQVPESSATPDPYPKSPSERDAWIVARRPQRNVVTSDRAYNAFVEGEVDEHGVLRNVATLLLSNRECPYRCLMCDLWKNTLEQSVPSGAIRAQIDAMLAIAPAAPVIKLYNAGSFFDTKAIPPGDFEAIAERLSSFERVIVECHPALVGPSVQRFAGLLAGKLEVAMGLEVADDRILDLLNKRMTLAMYADATTRLAAMGVEHRAFVLVQPPFVPPHDAVRSAVATTEYAFTHGATAVSLIPVRSGNGALDALTATGDFAEPSLAAFEDAHDAALVLGAGRVLADWWDLKRFSSCDACFEDRDARIRRVNFTQRVAPRVTCARCGTG
ncbi:MAG: radical SAM protein [Gemmatimonadetes bacterium]|nr:radical SAM protein [Gemmatimonadota bacterium]